jgi:hypothetical protein
MHQKENEEVNMKKIIILNVFCYILCTQLYSQVKISLQDPCISIIEENKSEFILKGDSVVVLKLNSNELDSILKNKVSYLKETFPKVRKNIEISFQNTDNLVYFRIAGNIPDFSIAVNKNLYGIFHIDDFQLFVYNHTDKCIDKLFRKIENKYFKKEQSDDFIYTINTPTWFYIIENGIFSEVNKNPQ